MERLQLHTTSRTEFIDITAQVKNIVRRLKAENGTCLVYVPHTTAGITINEHADPDVVADMAAALDKMVPRDDGYRHAEGNSAAHIKAAMMGSSASVILDKGALRLGTWQGIFFAEFDGPRAREVWVEVTPAT